MHLAGARFSLRRQYARSVQYNVNSTAFSRVCVPYCIRPGCHVNWSLPDGLAHHPSCDFLGRLNNSHCVQCGQVV
jgi:hypothetical protein